MFVVDGMLASSAGITVGIDMALHLIAEESGEALAASVAARRGMPRGWPGRQWPRRECDAAD